MIIEVIMVMLILHTVNDIDNDVLKKNNYCNDHYNNNNKTNI